MSTPTKDTPNIDKQINEILQNYAIRLGAINWLDDLPKARTILDRLYLELSLSCLPERKMLAPNGMSERIGFNEAIQSMESNLRKRFGNE